VVQIDTAPFFHPGVASQQQEEEDDDDDDEDL